MFANAYPFLITDLNLPSRIEYEFRTKDNVLYSCFFVLSNFSDGRVLHNAYEFGLTDVDEDYLNRTIDFNIKNTVVTILSDYLNRTKSKFFITVHYSNADEKANKRLKVFNRWFNEFSAQFPLKKYDLIIEADNVTFYKSIIIHSNHKHKKAIVTEFYNL